MKKEIVEYLDFEDDVKPKVGRPRLADKKTMKKAGKKVISAMDSAESMIAKKIN